ncbi:MAG: hypothetical protein KAU28_04735, partial [Phycisphaerae bacterium]|nr:hypothetical protein [Phycisphaerae bacterium]
MAEPSKTLREILRVIASRFIGMVLIFVVIVGAVGVATYFTPKQYRSKAMLRAQPSAMANPLELKTASLREEVSLFVNTQRQIILSDDVIASALILLEDPSEELPPGAPNEEVDRQKWEELNRNWDEKVAQYQSDNAEYVRKAEKCVSMVTPGGPDATFAQVFTIQVDWPEQRDEARRLDRDPKELAAERAHDFNARIVETYVNYRYPRLETEQIYKTVQSIDEALISARKRVADTSKALEEFTKKVGGDLLLTRHMSEGGGSGVETGLAARISELQSEVSKIEVRLAEVMALRDVITVELKKASTDIVVPDVVSEANPSIKTIEDAIVRLQLKLDSLTPRYTDDYKEIRDTRAELTAVHRQLYNELKNQHAKLEQAIGGLAERQQSLENILKPKCEKMAQLEGKVFEYERLRD